MNKIGGFLIAFILTVGLTGLFVSMMINQYVSVETLRAQQNLESYRVYLTFLESKLNRLEEVNRDMTEMAAAGIESAGKNEPAGKAAEAAEKDAENRCESLRLSYRTVRHFFSDDSRRELDVLAENIYAMRAEKTARKGRPPENYVRLAEAFEKAYTKAVDEELIRVVNNLSHRSAPEGMTGYKSVLDRLLEFFHRDRVPPE
jgi:hypothetical protein